MEISANDNNLQHDNKGNAHVHLPLEALLNMLRGKGFNIRPDDYIEILKVIEKFGTDDLDEAGRLICPLIATSEEEQVRFYKVFEEYKRNHSVPVMADSVQVYTRWYFLGGILLVLVLATVYFFSTSDAGPAGSAEIPLDSSAICNEIPEPSLEVLSNGTGGYYAGDTILFRASMAGNYPSITRNLWIINSDTLFNLNSDTLSHRFEEPGDYLLSYIAVTESLGSSCIKIAELNLHIVDKSAGNYRLIVQQTGTPIEPQSSLHILWSFLLLGCGSVCLVMVALSRFKNGQKESGQKEAPDVKEQSVSQSGPPYEVPFENNALRLVFTERSMNEVFRTMRQKTMDELEILNVSKTIRKTIRAGGYPELIYSNQLKHRDFLILVDRSNPRSLQCALFDFLAKLYREQNISIERFYYRENFGKCSNEQYPQGISLRRLSELYRHHTLVILGSCHELVYKGYAVIEKQLLEVFAEWEYKAILTPVPFQDWSSQENIIRKYMILLPADVEGQQRLVPAIEERQFNQQAYLSSFKSWYETGFVDFTDTGEIREYMDDEALFQWVCALAVYPRLRWEILVEVGYHVLEQYHQTEKLNFANLLKICRISWMHEGSIPERTRLELMKQLTENNERTTRITLLNMFAYADNFYKGSHFFGEEKEMQKLTSQFLLYANDPVEYASFNSAHEEFKNLWKNNLVTDAPLRMYIDKKPGDNWQTLVKSDERNVGIEEHISAAITEAPEKKKKQAQWLIITAVFFFICWGFLYFFQDRLINNRVASLLHLATVDSAKMVTLNLTVDPVVDCDNDTSSSPGLIKQLTGSVTFSDSAYSFVTTPVYSDNQTIIKQSIQVPFNRLHGPDAIVSLRWNNENATAQTISFTNSNISLRISDCSPDNRVASTDSSSVLPAADSALNNEILKETAIPSALNEIWTGSRNNRLVTLDVNRKIIYYSTGDKNSYGMYRIQNVYRTASGAYKLVTNADNQYLVIFARNVQPNSFELSICPERVNTIEETASINENACDGYDRMRIYYENEIAGIASEKLPHVFTRFKSDDLTNSQQKKLQNIMGEALNERNYGVEFYFRLRKNSFFSGRSNYNDQSRITKLINFASSSSRLSVKTFAGGPFDRDVLVLQDITGGETAPEPAGAVPEQNPSQRTPDRSGNKKY